MEQCTERRKLGGTTDEKSGKSGGGRGGGGAKRIGGSEEGMEVRGRLAMRESLRHGTVYRET